MAIRTGITVTTIIAVISIDTGTTATGGGTIIGKQRSRAFCPPGSGPAYLSQTASITDYKGGGAPCSDNSFPITCRYLSGVR
jgi:hypothetical protein